MLSTCLLSDVSQQEGCLAGLDVDAMVCILTQDEQHFLFSCPAYSDVRQKYASLFQQAFYVSDFYTNYKSEPNACGGFLRDCFSRRKSIVST